MKESVNLFYERNPHMKAVYSKRYRDKHKKVIKAKKKSYQQTEAGRKSNQMRVWKFRGVHIENRDELWKKYTTQSSCEFCETTLTKKYLEHNHFSKEIRGIVCCKCNQSQRRKDANFSACLKQLLASCSARCAQSP